MSDGTSTFRVGEDSYDRFMGRYSAPLAAAFADAVGVVPGQRVLDVGCGPGALTAELVRRLGADSVVAVDPSEPFAEACARRNPGVDVRTAAAEELPFADAAFDVALAQLVVQFMADASTGVGEMRRVVAPGGVVDACVWDYDDGMRMLRLFWDAALAVDPSAPDEARRLRYGRRGELGELLRSSRLAEVREGALDVQTEYASFADFWEPFTLGVGPAGAYCVALAPERQAALRDELRGRLGDPPGAFVLSARAWYAIGRVP